MFFLRGQVGPQRKGDGEFPNARMGRNSDLLVNLLGRYFELAKRGKLWFAETAVGGVAPGTAIGTTAAFALHNPPGANVDAMPPPGRPPSASTRRSEDRARPRTVRIRTGPVGRDRDSACFVSSPVAGPVGPLAAVHVPTVAHRATGV